MFDDFSPIYRPDYFHSLPIGTTVMLLGSNGPVMPDRASSPFFFIDYAEPAFALNRHGVTILWTHTAAAAPAGYELPQQGGVAAGLIAPGGQVTMTPGVFNLGAYELLQFRFDVRPIVWAAAGNAVDDIDLMVALPQSINRWTTLGNRGRVNMMAQVQMPGDAIVGPLQGANLPLPAVAPSIAPWNGHPETELWCYEQTGPSFTILNGGVAATQAGDAIGLYIWGYDYKLSAALPDTTWINRQVPGASQPMLAPPRFVTLPIMGRGK